MVARLTRIAGVLAVALVAVLAVSAASPPRADAALAGHQLSIMMDDDILLYGSDTQRERALDMMQRIGVDVVRVTVLWNVIAPDRRRRGFDGRNARHYDLSVLDRYDRLVRSALARNIQPLLNVTPPGPRWAHRRTRNRGLDRRGTAYPNRAQFARFVEMIGRRYSGTYRDENDGQHILPRVHLWSIGNEPNQGGWLGPQWRREGRRWIPVSPHLYRDLYVSGRSALRRAGHRGGAADRSRVYIGELAPIGAAPRTALTAMRPIQFLREMFCLNSRYGRLNRRQARERRCPRSLPRIHTDGFAYHPYTRERSPDHTPRHRDEAMISQLGRIEGALDRIATRTQRLPEGLPLILTEFGYQTNPPDPYNGVRLQEQVDWTDEADFIAYRNPRVIGMTQFLLRDSPPRSTARVGSRAYWGNYQSGLLYHDLRPKPAFFTYPVPAVFRRAGQRVGIWGQLRFLKSPPPNKVEIQFRPEGSQVFTTALTLETRAGNFFLGEVVMPQAGTWRAVWRSAKGEIDYGSREVRVGGP